MEIILLQINLDAFPFLYTDGEVGDNSDFFSNEWL